MRKIPVVPILTLDMRKILTKFRDFWFYDAFSKKFGVTLDRYILHLIYLQDIVSPSAK